MASSRCESGVESNLLRSSVDSHVRRPGATFLSFYAMCHSGLWLIEILWFIEPVSRQVMLDEQISQDKQFYMIGRESLNEFRILSRNPI